MDTVAAVVLAAGESVRMGTHKMLLPYAGEALVAHVVRQLEAVDLAPVVVVTGHRAVEVEVAVAGTTAQCVHNAEYEQGMLTSVRAGIAALPEDCAAAMVAIGDQPELPRDVLEAQLAAFREGSSIVVPRHHLRRGHPLLIARQHFEEVLNDFDGIGLRGLLHRHEDAVKEIHTEHDEVLEDLDYPEDYLAALRRLEASE